MRKEKLLSGYNAGRERIIRRTPKFKVGDKVKLNPDCGLKFEFEEAKLGKTYRISEVIWSQTASDWYYQLKGIRSSYQLCWLMEAK